MNNHVPPPPQFNQQDEWSTDFDSVDAIESNLIPTGQYRMELEKVSHERVKSGENSGKPQANCQFTITDERQHSRKVFQYFAPHVPFQAGMVKALAIATNTPIQINMYNMLISMIGKEFMATIGVRKSGNTEFSDTNVINGIKSLSSQPAQQYQPAQPANYMPPQQPYAPAPPAQSQQQFRPANLPANAQLGDDGKTWWVPNPASPYGWDIWQ